MKMVEKKKAKKTGIHCSTKPFSDWGQAPGLVDRVMTGVEGYTPTGGTCPNYFSNPIDQYIHTQCALSLKTVVSEWRSVIPVSLTVGGGVCLIKPSKLYVCTQTHYKHDKDGPTAHINNLKIILYLLLKALLVQ